MELLPLSASVDVPPVATETSDSFLLLELNSTALEMSELSFRHEYIYNLPAAGLNEFTRVMDSLPVSDWLRFGKITTTLSRVDKNQTPGLYACWTYIVISLHTEHTAAVSGG